jgi:hypothetical protein
MIDKQLRSGIAQRKLLISAAELLYFYSYTNRFIKSGSKCSLGCHGGSYKLLRGYPPSPLDDDRGLHLYPQGVCRFESHPLRSS